MKRILIVHLILGIVTGVIFTSLGKIDKGHLDKASLSHKPELLFAHDKLLVRDGGSIYWDSLIYWAQENRVGAGFQGVTWTWKFHNLIWIWLIIGGSTLGSLFTLHWTKNA
jgi:hypothetical protein